MKPHSAAPLLLLLFGLAISPATFAQSLPASMAYSTSVLVRNAPADTGQKLLIADNSLIHDDRSAFDLSEIPAAPDCVVRDSKIPATTGVVDGKADFANAGSTASSSKLRRSAALMGVLAIAYLATRKRPDARTKADISELRNFPKKQLARHQAHA